MVASLDGGAEGAEAADLVLSSGGGIVVEPENSEALAQAILELRQNPGRQEMGRRGRQFVQENYAWPEIILWLPRQMTGG